MNYDLETFQRHKALNTLLMDSYFKRTYNTVVLSVKIAALKRRSALKFQHGNTVLSTFKCHITAGIDNLPLETVLFCIS